MNTNLPKYRNPPKPPPRRNPFSQEGILDRFSERVRTVENGRIAEKLMSKEIDFNINDSGNVVSEEGLRPETKPTHLQKEITQDQIFSYIYYGISAIGLIGGIIYVIIEKL